MQIVSDRGMDMSPAQQQGLDIHLVPLTLTLEGKTYRSGEDIEPDEFYRLLAASDAYPSTSQPSAGDFAVLYRHLAASDPEILSIHISSGLSGTCDAARAGAALVPGAEVTVIDTKTLSGAMGWRGGAPPRPAKAGWPKERILTLLKSISAATDTVYTLATLKYLLHGGRISHLKGLIASVLSIKPLISVEKERGTYVSCGQARLLDQAILKLADYIAARHEPGTRLRLQALHGHNASGAEMLQERMEKLFQCTWLPTNSIAPVLGAHTGPGLVGIAFAPIGGYPALP